MNYEFVMAGLEAVQISLNMMTGSTMAKQIYKEEVYSIVVIYPDDGDKDNHSCRIACLS